MFNITMSFQVFLGRTFENAGNFDSNKVLQHYYTLTLMSYINSNIFYYVLKYRLFKNHYILIFGMSLKVVKIYVSKYWYGQGGSYAKTLFSYQCGVKKILVRTDTI